MARGYRTIKLAQQKTSASVYTSPRIADALKDIMANASLYEGVKLTQILEAVHVQGKKDGARETIESLDTQLNNLKRQIPHKRPGRPRKR
jgi:hypothetical protein